MYDRRCRVGPIKPRLYKRTHTMHIAPTALTQALWAQFRIVVRLHCSQRVGGAAGQGRAGQVRGGGQGQRPRSILLAPRPRDRPTPHRCPPGLHATTGTPALTHNQSLTVHTSSGSHVPPVVARMVGLTARMYDTWTIQPSTAKQGMRLAHHMGGALAAVTCPAPVMAHHEAQCKPAPMACRSATISSGC
jgi:hypothetical protein